MPNKRYQKVKLSLKKIKEKNIDSVVSVCDVNQYHPLRMKKILNGRLVNFIKQKKKTCLLDKSYQKFTLGLDQYTLQKLINYLKITV